MPGVVSSEFSKHAGGWRPREENRMGSTSSLTPSSERSKRRKLTQRVIRRRLTEYRKGFSPSSIVDRQAWAYRDSELGAGYWDRNRPRSCGCSKRKAGSPKCNSGMCDAGRRDRIYLWRAQVRELNRKLSRGYDPEDDPVVILSSPKSVSNTGLWRA